MSWLPPKSRDAARRGMFGGTSARGLWWSCLGVLIVGWTGSTEQARAQGPPPGGGRDEASSRGPDVGLVAELEALIPRRMRAHDVPGLNILVIRSGDPVWAAAYGWADREAERPMTLDAVFRAESISKPVTAWGVVVLAEAGALALDEPIQTQLRTWAVPAQVPALTPRELLSHRAGVGLGDYTARYTPYETRPTLIQSLESELVMIGRPGAAFSYSDTGYNLLELLVQDATGEDFGIWMEMHVLEPLGMGSSSFDWEPSFADRLPVAYDLKGRRVDPYVYPGRGSGGLFATVHDVGRFARAEVGSVYRGGLSDEGIALLHAPVVQPAGLYGVVAEGYGLGHFTETLSDGREAVWHGGQGLGWMTHVHIVPESGDAVVLLANSQRAWPLFADVLRAWSQSLGVEPVRMSRITWAAPLAWLVIMVALVGTALLGAKALGRVGLGHASGDRLSRPSTPSRQARMVALVLGLGLMGTVAWASVQDYLFLFSILPATTGWLGLAILALGVALVAWALMPGASGPPGVDGTHRSPSARHASLVAGIGLAAALLGGNAAGLAAQLPVIDVEGGWMPPSDVTRSLSGPATEARVTLFRGSVVVPLVLRRDALMVVPRISGSRVGITPRPIDPDEPVWVEVLYDLDLEIVARGTLSERDRLAVVLAPGIASDFRGQRSDHLTFQGAALFTREFSPNATWGGGVSVTNAFGEFLVVPLISFQWQGSRLQADLLAPSQGEVLWTPGGGVALGVQAMIDGNVYGLGREGTLEGGRVRYSLADVGPTLRYDLGWGLRFSVSAGVSFRRRLEVEDSEGLQVEDAALGRGWRMGVGLSWLLPEDPG